ncbi:MAG: hypothetical protein ACR2MQ_00865 [Gemmatimonadaceae bacterium]
MYSTCLFCHNDLGSNEVVEHFPVGRRLAFDGARGRLWVVCRSCERWNLTPLEERWEAIEECEKLFRGTTLRMSTDHIGLARVSEGLQLVRVGDPQRPEMAAWRYGDQFGKRQRRYWTMTGAGALAIGAVLVGHFEFGLLAGVSANAFNVVNLPTQVIRKHRIVARVPTPQGRVEVSRFLLKKAKIVRSTEHPWMLEFQHATRAVRSLPIKPQDWWRYTPANRRAGSLSSVFHPSRTVRVAPDQAGAALGALLPAINARGASKSKVASAVDLIEYAKGPDKLLAHAAAFASKPHSWNAMAQGTLGSLPSELRLALEMVTHEDDERRALEGELAQLEQRWKEAEEVADISDNMFVPSSVTDWIRRVKA